MTVVLKEKTDLVVPVRVRRQAGFKPGDRLEFKVSDRSIVITAARTEKPTRSELAAIQRGEAEIARGEYLPLSDLLNNVDRRPGKGRAKTTRKISR